MAEIREVWESLMAGEITREEYEDAASEIVSRLVGKE